SRDGGERDLARAANSVLPSPLWGGWRAKRAGWGRAVTHERGLITTTPTPSPSPQGGRGATECAVRSSHQVQTKPRQAGGWWGRGAHRVRASAPFGVRRSNRNRGGVVVVEPLHALAQAHLLPFARHLLGDAVLVGKARRKRARLVLARLAHHHRGALPADLLVAREGRVRLAQIPLDTPRHDATPPARHHHA